MRSENLGEGEEHLASLLVERDVLVQPYLRSVQTYGERALVWIDGELCHAVRKNPRFQGEDENVSTEAMPISDAEARVAEEALEVVRGLGDLLYARIDMAPGPDGRPMIMELELVEPSLFFPQNPAAAAPSLGRSPASRTSPTAAPHPPRPPTSLPPQRAHDGLAVVQAVLTSSFGMSWSIACRTGSSDS